MPVKDIPDHNDVKKEAEKLSGLICRTEEYKEYQEALASLRERKELRISLNDFRRESLELQIQKDPDQDGQDVLDLFQKYHEMLSEPLVQVFLTAEQGLCRMLREVYDELASHVEADLSFMEEEQKEG